MAKRDLRTRNGYNFYDMASMLQKAIRRSDYQRAAFAAYELSQRFRKYVWKRLLVISAEDCYGIITKEIIALKIASDELGGDDGIFMAKAIVLLCDARKNRDACYVACNFMQDDGTLDPDDIEVTVPLEEAELVDRRIPDWVFDVHTFRGKKMGKTIEDMIYDEQQALKPLQLNMFDDGDWEPFLKSYHASK